VETFERRRGQIPGESLSGGPFNRKIKRRIATKGLVEKERRKPKLKP